MLYLLSGIIISLVVFIKSLRSLRLSSITERRVLITGCDSGFGRELAIRLDKKGVLVYAGSLREQSMSELQDACSSRLKALKLDVTDSISLEAAKVVVENDLAGNALWGIVNNAGITGAMGPFEWISKEQARRAMEVNLWGMYDVTRIFLPLVKKGKQGRIVNMSSVLGRLSNNVLGYAMSKHAVESFSDGLSYDLAPFNITVHVLEPGYFKTNIADCDSLRREIMKSYENASPEIREEYGGREFAEACINYIQSSLKENVSSETHLVVDAYEHALFARFPQNRYQVGYDSRYFFSLLWHFPVKFQMFVFKVIEKIQYRVPIPKSALGGNS